MLLSRFRALSKSNVFLKKYSAFEFFLRNIFHKSRLKNWTYLYLVAIIIRVISGIYTPVNILGFAPHDDTLFYTLAKNISNFTWLGDYHNTTLIKGPVFPLFLASSIVTGIPLRLLETLLIILSSLYFINSLNFLKFSKLSYFLLFVLIINFPFQYSALDYRLLRDIIYPWVLLLVLSEIIYFFRLYIHFNKNKSIYFLKNLFLHIFFLSFYFFLFFNIREEGVWIFPAIFLLIFLSLIFFSIKKLKSFYFLIFSFFLINIFLFLFNYIFISLNSISYNYDKVVEFKDTNYVNGYSSLYRFEDTNANNFDPRIGIKMKTWDKLFAHVPSLNKIKPYIHGQGFKNWLSMGCEAIINQRPNDNSRNIDCKNEMTVGYQIWAFRDALFDAGFDTPLKVSKYMQKVSEEINKACENINLDLNCSKKISNMLPPWNFSIDAFYHAFKYYLYSITHLINSSYAGVNNYPSSGKINELINIADNLNLFMTNPKKTIDNNTVILNEDFIDIYKIHNKLTDKTVGYVDNLRYDNYTKELHLSGWSFYERPVDKILIFINKKNLCQVKPSYARPDITKKYSNIGFFCNSIVNVNPNTSINIEIFAELENNFYKINIIEPIIKRLDNKFDKECFIENNPDIKNLINSKLLLKDDVEKFWSTNLSFDNRPCAPLSQNIELIKNKNVFFDNLNPILKKFIECYGAVFYYFYYYFIKFFIFVIPFLFVKFLIQKKYEPIVLLSVLASLFLTRAFMISILDYSGMAPISPLYLFSGTFIYYVLCCILFIYFLRYVLLIKHEKI